MQRNENHVAMQYFCLHSAKIGRLLEVREARGNGVAAAWKWTRVSAWRLRRRAPFLLASLKTEKEIMRSKLVVVGNGMAGCRAIEELLARAPGTFDITIFGAEPRVNYNRIMLSPVLAGEKAYEDIIINGHDWYAENGIRLHAGDPVVTIDRAARAVITASGHVEPYDVLLLATGSNPFILPVPGKDLEGIVTFRDMDDVEAMLRAARTGRHAVVIGGGLLGLEAANGLNLNGMDVTVIHLADTLMERQLDEAAGFLLKEELEGRGVKILTGAVTEAYLGETRVRAVRLSDGTDIPADIVVVAAGIRPNVALAQDAGLAVNRGIVVDDLMHTSDPDIFAVGECVEHRGMVYGLVAPLWDMCRAFADCLAARDGAGYQGSIISTKLKVTGVDVFSAGDFSTGDGKEDIVFRDARRGVYKRLIVAEDRLVGAILYGDARDGAWYTQLLKDGTPIADIRDTMIFGQSLQGAPANPTDAVAALSDEAEICGCNGVCKGTITGAIAEHGLTDIEGVRAHTKASGSCGSCTGLVEQLLALALGDAFQGPAGPKPLCKCTDKTHDDVRRLIIAHELKAIPDVMQHLGWMTPDGCASCRPALNYYLLCAWPGDYRDDRQSRFINERAHGNIQKDGTFSVVPRMWGGVTNPRELRAIADVAEEFDIPALKVTGGQRIDLLGVKKEDLPAVWDRLNAAGMVSGHAYGKALRTVKTCVGSEWCRFGTQDSTRLGIELERMAWGSWMPHKFKMAVSGCPRNCAEVTIKDFGVVCVDSGYELHVGGNGGMKLRATDFLAKVETEPQVLEYAAAFIQLYRETGHYLERTAPWLERLGLDVVKARLVDDAAARVAYCARFLHSQTFMQHDPWAEHARGRDIAEFKQLETV
jgi:nitrite reductase (NADH) large subunit